MKEKLMLLKESLIDFDFKIKMERIKKGKDFCNYLDNNGVKYDLCIKHKEVLGCDESKIYYMRFLPYLTDDFIICKNLFVHERKGQKRCFLIITDG